MSDNLYYIESLEHGPIGHDRVWWRPDSGGYTTDLDDAGIYTASEARLIVQGARGNERAWPLQYIRLRAIRVVRADILLEDPDAILFAPPEEGATG